MRRVVCYGLACLTLAAAVVPVAGCSAAVRSPGKQDTIHQVIVPDVVGMTEQAALSTLAEAGFVRGSMGTTAVEARRDGLIVEQRPAPGGRLRVGSSVDMTVGVSAGE